MTKKIKSKKQKNNTKKKPIIKKTPPTPHSIREGLLSYIAYYVPDLKYTFSYESAMDIFEHIYGRKYSIRTIWKELSNLKTDGLVEYKRHYNHSYPALSSKGRLEMKAQLPFRKYGDWDGKWRIVIFDIPEKQRPNRWSLRHKLKDLGFGNLQKSAFISPYPLLGIVNRYASDLGIKQFMQTFEITKLDNDKKVIAKVWPIDKINDSYNQFIYEIDNNKKDIYWPLRAKSLELEFIEIYKLDPQLPKEFLPDNWAGIKAYKKFKELVNSY